MFQNITPLLGSHLNVKLHNTDSSDAHTYSYVKCSVVLSGMLLEGLSWNKHAKIMFASWSNRIFLDLALNLIFYALCFFEFLNVGWMGFYVLVKHAIPKELKFVVKLEFFDSYTQHLIVSVI